MYRNEDREITPDEIIPRDEMLLDVCLEEVLSGQSPPDLSARILAKLHANPETSTLGMQANTEPVAEPPRIPTAAPVAPPPAAPPVQVAVAAHTTAGVKRSEGAVVVHARNKSHHTHSRRDGLREWTGMTIAASVLAVGLGVGLLAWQFGGAPTVATNQPDAGNGSPEIAETVPRENVNTTTQRDRNALASTQFSEPLFGAQFPAVPEEAAVPWPLPYAVHPEDTADVVKFVNQQLAGRGANTGELDDDQWCQRVFQQILGRDPSSEELVDFAASSADDKRAQLVDSLLTGEAYRKEYAHHWADVWADELLAANGSAAHRDGLRSYLVQSFLAGKPHDELTQELIAAGNAADTPAGAANFVLANLDDDRVDDKSAALAAKVTNVFLGHQGQCAQCHDHSPSQLASREGLSQEQFWQLAAFFQQTKIKRDRASGQTQLADADYVGLSGAADEAELFYDAPNDQRKIAYPVFIDGTPISRDGRVDVVNRRQELAKLIAVSEDFAKASVELYWSKMLGSMPQGKSPLADRELAQGLAEQFAAHDYDPRQLLRWIALSDANNAAAEEQPAPLYESVAVALDDVRLQGRPITRDEAVLFARVAPRLDGNTGDSSIFVPTTGDAPVDLGDGGKFLERLNRSEMTFANKVRHVFLKTLSRDPTREELTAARQMLSARNGNLTEALDDIAWAITRSAEYR